MDLWLACGNMLVHLLNLPRVRKFAQPDVETVCTLARAAGRSRRGKDPVRGCDAAFWKCYT